MLVIEVMLTRQASICEAKRQILKPIMILICTGVLGVVIWPWIVYLVHWYWALYVTWTEKCYLDSLGEPGYHKSFVFAVTTRHVQY